MPTEDKLICQVSAICTRYCSHKWEHDVGEKLGCSERGCTGMQFHYGSSVIDEFGETFSLDELQNHDPARCIDFNYFMENTDHGQVIVTKGTAWENWHEVREERMRKAEEERVEKRRRHMCDYVMQDTYRQTAQDVYIFNPNGEEDVWRGRNWTGRG